MIPHRLSSVLEPSTGDETLVGPAAEPGRLTLDGEVLVNMASCNYLGFTRHPRVVAAAQQAVADWGLGTAATRSLSGSTTLHRGLERALAGWVGTQDAVLFSSCWTANAAVMAALASLAGQAGTTLEVFSDRLNHASIIDAIRAQRSAIGGLHRYDHGQLDSLRDALGASPSGLQRVVITDGVFSMEGDLAPLPELLTLCATYDALLIVDDSHGTGLTGGSGRGTVGAAWPRSPDGAWRPGRQPRTTFATAYASRASRCRRSPSSAACKRRRSTGSAGSPGRRFARRSRGR